MIDHVAARRHLLRADPVLARLIRSVGPFRMRHSRAGSHFEALIRSIVYQQISGKAAATIHGRFTALYPRRRVRPELVSFTTDAAMREAGLSRQKIAYIRDLALRVDRGDLPLHRVRALTDTELIDRLSAVKGIGKWTAQMFLMFRLGRPDVLPELDLGIQNAIQRAYDLPRRPKPAEVLRMGEPWRPHATVASWYLWRSLEI